MLPNKCCSAFSWIFLLISYYKGNYLDHELKLPLKKILIAPLWLVIITGRANKALPRKGVECGWGYPIVS